MSEMKSLTLNGNTYDCFVDDVARSSVVITSASGENISVSDSSDRPLVGLNIYGKSIQNGTPTPDAPVDIESIGDDGNVVVTVGSNAMAVTLANGLRGIKVTDKSLATYTDANGQMWCADEVDFARRVYIQRIGSVTFDGSSDEHWGTNVANTGTYRVCTSILSTKLVGAANTACAPLLSSSYVVKTANNTYLNETGLSTSPEGTIFIYDPAYNTEDVSPWLAYLATTNLTLFYVMKTTTEKPLSDTEMESYKAMHTNKPNTTILNGENAYMSIKYVADAKSYIDNKVSGILAATVE